MNSTTKPAPTPGLNLTEAEGLALLELLTDKGLMEYARATPDLERVFTKLEVLEAAFITRKQHERASL